MTQTNYTADICGYRVTLDLDMDGTGTTGCWIERGDYSASLECADGEGVLENSRGEQRSIHPATVDAIRAWAERKGY